VEKALEEAIKAAETADAADAADAELTITPSMPTQ
jgi:hypothetical protein